MMIPDKRNALILLVGVAGSGKSTWGKKFAQEQNIKYLSSDETRAKFGTGPGDQTVTGQVFGYLEHMVDNLLEQGKSVMVDATNIYRKDRKGFLNAAKKYGAYTIAIVFERPKEILMKQLAKRVEGGGMNVPEFAVDRMLARYQRPEETEFDKIVDK